MIAAFTATVAAVVSLQAYADQRDINRSQLALNTDTQQRAERRYATRVNWWASTEYKNVVFIQNRSPVPVTDVLIVPRGRRSESEIMGGAYDIGDVPPCRTFTARLQEPHASVASSRLFPVHEFDLVFNDPSARWIRSREELRKADARSTGKAQRPTNVEWKSVGDCGEDG
ncbi:hypothetical protein [Actinoplanes aureus]|uniref:Uncharacterized protein n=1 Tax=Actinoplanes aureus TaxID=2792083 RepID=A0A931G603_9ACTN|nr:hypothetical protein [Actinoplanes aureus]MBG0569341.1 hypothetical protein [Actinoplanes aureus]